MEANVEREVRSERQRQTEGDKRCGDCSAKRRKTEDYADRRNSYMETAEQIYTC